MQRAPRVSRCRSTACSAAAPSLPPRRAHLLLCAARARHVATGSTDARLAAPVTSRTSAIVCAGVSQPLSLQTLTLLSPSAAAVLDVQRELGTVTKKERAVTCLSHE